MHSSLPGCAAIRVAREGGSGVFLAGINPLCREPAAWTAFGERGHAAAGAKQRAQVNPSSLASPEPGPCANPVSRTLGASFLQLFRVPAPRSSFMGRLQRSASSFKSPPWSMTARPARSTEGSVCRHLSFGLPAPAPIVHPRLPFPGLLRLRQLLLDCPPTLTARFILSTPVDTSNSHPLL